MVNDMPPTPTPSLWERTHEDRHTRTEKALADSTLRLEKQVETAASRLERQVETAATRLEKQVETTRVALTEMADVHAKNHEKEHQAHYQIHQVEKEARESKEKEVDKRLEGMNEVRGQLDKQATTFATISTVAEMANRIEEKIDGATKASMLRSEALEKTFIEYRDTHSKFASEQIAQLTAQISGLSHSVDTRLATIAGQEAGQRITTGKLMGALAGVSLFLGIVVVVMNLIAK